jgi:transposase InsO family protein
MMEEYSSSFMEAHLIPVRTTYQAPDLARVFISEIVRLHGMPKKIISDRGSVVTGRFWTSFQEALGTQLNFSTAYHPETDGQTECTNHTLEDMLRMYVMDQQKRWEEFLPLVEFAYNNSYRAPLRWRRLSSLRATVSDALELGSA